MVTRRAAAVQAFGDADRGKPQSVTHDSRSRRLPRASMCVRASREIGPMAGVGIPGTRNERPGRSIVSGRGSVGSAAPTAALPAAVPTRPVPGKRAHRGVPGRGPALRGPARTAAVPGKRASAKRARGAGRLRTQQERQQRTPRGKQPARYFRVGCADSAAQNAWTDSCLPSRQIARAQEERIYATTTRRHAHLTPAKMAARTYPKEGRISVSRAPFLPCEAVGANEI